MPWPGENSDLLGLAVLAVGAATAIVVRRIVRRLSDRHVQDSGAFAKVLAALPTLALWATLAAAAALSLGVLETGQSTGLLNRALNLTPQLIVSVLVIAVGHLVGTALRELVQRHRQTVNVAPSGAYWLVAAPALIIAAQQLGLDVSFLADLALVAFGVACASLGLAFALGSRQHVANLVARRSLDIYRIGDRLRIGELEGTVVELRRTGAVLSAKDGLVTVPATRFAEDPVIRLPEVSD